RAKRWPPWLSRLGSGAISRGLHGFDQTKTYYTSSVKKCTSGVDTKSSSTYTFSVIQIASGNNTMNATFPVKGGAMPHVKGSTRRQNNDDRSSVFHRRLRRPDHHGRR